MIDYEMARKTLVDFLSMPISESKSVLNVFASLPGALCHFDGEHRNFVYVPGTRKDRVILVAHADTVWDGDTRAKQSVELIDGVIYGTNKEVGIGADDRAGCAILWLLRESGHSLLVTDGEERGAIATAHLIEKYPELASEINDHAYAIQLDRRNSSDYKVYNLPVTEEFMDFIEDNTGYKIPDSRSGTDIVVLCKRICGANLSVGYRNEHTENETIVLDDWYKTLTLLEKMITPPQRQFLMKK